MTPAEKEKLGRAIRARIAMMANSGSDQDDLDLSKTTGALPVYADIGGTLLVTPDLKVLAYEHVTGKVVEEQAYLWRVMAYRRAAKRFPELAALHPQRQPTAKDCVDCAGTGLRLGKFDCVTCAGLGWLPTQAGNTAPGTGV